MILHMLHNKGKALKVAILTAVSLQTPRVAFDFYFALIAQNI